jgi:Ferric reductase like transmembrane component
MITMAVAGPSAFWFLTRGTGAISLVLLTLSLALGVINVRRTRIARVPRFVLDAIHRNASLLAVTFLVVHVTTALLDGFAPITLLDVVVPFGSAYRPVWLGLGAVAFDLMIAITVTSLLRRRFGHSAWRATHWLAYASWPVALLHGLGTGTDTRTHWMLVLAGGCVVVMIAAVLVRVVAGWPDHLAVRVSALGASVMVPIGLTAWLPTGPLAHGWAGRAGTPTSVLAAAHAVGGPNPTPVVEASASGPAGSSPEHREASGSFRASVSGTLRQAEVAAGQALVDISVTAPGQRLGVLHVRIEGRPLAGGGVELGSSRVTLGPSSNPDQYDGRVTALAGSTIEARVSDSRGSGLVLLARLQLQPGGGAVNGTLIATSQGAAQ